MGYVKNRDLLQSKCMDSKGNSRKGELWLATGPAKAQRKHRGRVYVWVHVHGFLNTVCDFSVPSFIIMGFFFPPLNYLILEKSLLLIFYVSHALERE